MYYLNLIFSSLLVMPVLFALDEDVQADQDAKEQMINEIQASEADICQKYSLESDDELNLLMNNLCDEEFIRILFLSKQLEKNYPSYSCEIDKIIDRCFKQNKKRLNFSNSMRALKAGIFFACGAAGIYGLFDKWHNIILPGNKRYGVILGLISTIFGWQCMSELEKISNNFDQNQLLYKAIAMKNALLLYRKK